MELDPDAIQARSEALVGQVLGGRYRIDAVLGIGAMGAVFRAYHTGLAREVAVKLLHKDLMASPDMRARFAREAAAVSKLDHPNCVRITDFGSDEDYQYLVMELLQGAPLSNALEGPIAPERAVEIADEILAGLEHAHGHGLVHRDIKPDNIFMVREGGGKTRAKVLDFGIVKLQEGQDGPQLTKMGMIFGTPHFMSPEQATGGEVDLRSDLYSVGIVLHLMLSGQLPFDSDEPIKVLRHQIRNEPPPLPTSVPLALRELVTKLLAKKPEDRHPTATAVRTALASVRQSFEPVAASTRAPARTVAVPPSGPFSPAGPMAGAVPGAAGPGAAGPGAVPGAAGPGAVPGAAGPGAVPGAAGPGAVGPGAAGLSAAGVSAVSAAGVPAGLGYASGVPVGSPGATGLSVGTAAGAAADVPAGPGIVAPRDGGGKRAPSWWPASREAQWILGGVGVLAVVVVIAIVVGGDGAGEAPPESDPGAVEARAKMAELLGVKTDDAPSGDAPSTGEAEVEKETASGAGKPSANALEASLASVDALLEARQFEAARITLGPLLEAYAGEAPLHRRMAQVLTALGGPENRSAALDSYAAAISADAALLHDEAFMTDLLRLMDDPKLRAPAVDLAIDHLGSSVDERLIQWLNVQVKPLDHDLRHRIVAHLDGNDRGDEVNRPLQRALDLWQAHDAESPCEAFTRALDQAIESPDSFLVGTLHGVDVPQVAAAGPKDEDGTAECPGAAEKLDKARAQHDERFMGIDPVVPKAYRKRPASTGSSSNRKQRRR